jgi:Na+/melibiose symporter-like transporter
MTMDNDEEAAHHASVIREEAQIAQAFASTTTQAERNRAFGILFISLVCMGAGQTVLFAILPPLSRQLGLSELQTTTIFAISATIWVFSSTFWGKKSDFWGRRPVMLLGLLAFAISFALFASVMLAGLHKWLPAFPRVSADDRLAFAVRHVRFGHGARRAGLCRRPHHAA